MAVVNKAALDLIAGFEGFVDHWYPDPAHGWKVPTCCYGHTDAAGEPKYATSKTKKFTKDEGLLILERDLATYAAHVRKAVKVPLNENQFGALTSFCFNLGPGNLNKSTLLKKLNRGDYDGAAGEFGKWVNAGGKRLNGLVRRRAAEAELFRSPAHVLAPPSNPVREAPVGRGWVSVLIGMLGALVKWLGRK